MVVAPRLVMTTSAPGTPAAASCAAASPARCSSPWAWRCGDRRSARRRAPPPPAGRRPRRPPARRAAHRASPGSAAGRSVDGGGSTCSRWKSRRPMNAVVKPGAVRGVEQAAARRGRRCAPGGGAVRIGDVVRGRRHGQQPLSGREGHRRVVLRGGDNGVAGQPPASICYSVTGQSRLSVQQSSNRVPDAASARKAAAAGGGHRVGEQLVVVEARDVEHDDVGRRERGGGGDAGAEAAAVRTRSRAPSGGSGTAMVSPGSPASAAWIGPRAAVRSATERSELAQRRQRGRRDVRVLRRGGAASRRS